LKSVGVEFMLFAHKILTFFLYAERKANCIIFNIADNNSAVKMNT